ncbi:hypothetical protein BGX27_004773 [Mortierella sp. AM989]|nr:hypothetical protein BGX27_004773 [Mortierella sp. AM989]
MGTNQSSMQARLQKKPKMTQQELQRQYQRNLSEQQLAEHLNARKALENCTSLPRSQDFTQIPGINGNTPSVIASTANNESFYHQRSTTIHSSSNAAKNGGRQNFRWIDEMSTEHTETNFTGIDISAVWPTEIRPRNCRFQVANAIQGLPFENNTFDFVYQRFMILAYPAKDWPFIVQELVRVTKPGGIIELTEMPIVSNANGPELAKVMEVLEQGCLSKGLDTKVAKKLDVLLRDAGVSDINSCHTSIPVGAWGTKVGQLMRENSAGLWSSLKGWIKELTGMNDAQYDAMIKRIFVEYETHRCYANCYCAWGVKPFPAEHPTALSTPGSQSRLDSALSQLDASNSGLNTSRHAAVI